MLEPEKKNQTRIKIETRKAEESDIAYVIHANREIEGERSKLTEEVLRRDLFTDTPKAFVVLAEHQGKRVGMAFFSFTYWASDGPILWVSQMYIEPEYRGGRTIIALRDELFEQASIGGAGRMVWATHNTADRSNKLWQRIGAKDLSENYSFWVKSV